ncbi:hypothetical protein MN0502_30920 [Arthrobacter sp. MN05-02]|nr:hypothetical protein MN0502_30920 [Arthrobacter sp. MN05-02]
MQHFAEDERAVPHVLEKVQPALEGGGGFEDAGRPDPRAGLAGEPGGIELADVGREVGAGGVDGLEEVLGG